MTPLLSLAKSLASGNPSVPVQFIYAAKNSCVQAFRDEIGQLSSGSEHFTTHFLYDTPLDDDLESGRCDRVGMLNTDLIRDWAPDQNTEYYFCGPKPFMQCVFASLKEMGVDESRIHFEFFGPRQERVPVETTA